MSGPWVDEHFDAPALDPRWTPLTPGGGQIAVADSTLRFSLPGARAGRYSDAQLDDYTGLPRRRYPWRPPLRLEVRARASHPAHLLRGTAGFGFWNYPMTAAGGVPRLPDAVWFFAASPPSNMALVPGGSGWGWKAQIVHAHRWGALAAGIPAAAAVLRARLTGRDDVAARWLQRLAGAHESLLDADLTAWHDYALEWRAGVARFSVDDRPVLVVQRPPRGPLGFIMWIDNQYAVATRRGVLRFGTLDAGAQWLELDRLRILSLSPPPVIQTRMPRVPSRGFP